MRRPMSRRAVITSGAALAVLASGCGADEPPAAPKAEDPEQALVRELIAGKEHTIGLYTALITAGAVKLEPFRRRHEEHLAELRRRHPRATAMPTNPPTTAPSPMPKVSLARLRDVERKAAALRPRQLGDASPALAQLIASIGACEALHALSLPKSA
ncbi:hypothetical protein OIE66_30160 [Nonomuraea sp. NBC_01738]|uniref:hypothetical protein n=1 Tax=Nonomuraea sp. NBC_01738 TaxID=2976003 RepID=UPI002E13EF9C|nr:hypothetical protein OIE66_30160 [Nonomuraea sp. NBC_01738]